MELKLKVASLKKCLLVWITVWMVLLSKTVYFGIVNKSTYQWVLYVSGIICGALYGLNIKRLQRQVKLVFPFIVLFILNAVFYLGEMSSESINELVGTALCFFVVAFVCSYLERKKFAKYYINTMAVICLISIPCFIIANTSESLARSLCQPGYDWKTRFGYSVFYTWGWNGTILTRNSGPFWEAGAFQGFILLATLMLLYSVDNGLIKERRKKWLFLLFVITIMTTGSTTGYILLIAVLFTQWERVKSLFSALPSQIKYISVILIASIVVAFIVQSGNISGKFSGQNTNSVLVRYSDLVNGIKMWTENPILGLGLTSQRQSLKALLGVDIDDSVGLSFMTYTYGIPFLLYYLFRMAKGIKEFFKGDRWQTVILFIIFIVLHMTEGLWWLPVYLYILFAQSDKSTIPE